MSKFNWSKTFNNVKESVSKRSPEILTGFGISGMLTTVIFAVKATPKAMQIVRIEQRDGGIVDKKTGRVSYRNAYVPRKLTAKEIVKMVWKCYIPTAISFTLSAGCLICANSVNSKRRAALATAYSLSETAFGAYREKVLEVIGETGEQAIRESIAKEKIENDPPNNKEIVFVDSSDTLCYDSISGRYFSSSIDKLNKAANELSRRLMDEMYISLNDFYYEIGLRNTKLGDELGWHVENGLIDLNFSTQMAPEGKPCIVVDYIIKPRYDYK